MTDWSRTFHSLTHFDFDPIFKKHSKTLWTSPWFFPCISARHDAISFTVVSYHTTSLPLSSSVTSNSTTSYATTVDRQASRCLGNSPSVVLLGRHASFPASPRYHENFPTVAVRPVEHHPLHATMRTSLLRVLRGGLPIFAVYLWNSKDWSSRDDVVLMTLRQVSMNKLVLWMIVWHIFWSFQNLFNTFRFRGADSN